MRITETQGRWLQIRKTRAASMVVEARADKRTKGGMKGERGGVSGARRKREEEGPKRGVNVTKPREPLINDAEQSAQLITAALSRGLAKNTN